MFFALLALFGLLCSQAAALGTEHSDAHKGHCCSACHAGHAPGVVQSLSFFFPTPAPQIALHAVEEAPYALPDRLAFAGPARATPA